MSKKLLKFLILFDNTSLLYFPGQFLSGRVLIELQEDTAALGMSFHLHYRWQFAENYLNTLRNITCKQIFGPRMYGQVFNNIYIKTNSLIINYIIDNYIQNYH